MSLVSAFATSMAGQAMPMIGREPVVIGSTTVQCVISEVNDAKEFGDGGFENTKSLQAVCLAADLPAGSIVKRACTARGASWRVDSASIGATFATLTLGPVTKS